MTYKNILRPVLLCALLITFFSCTPKAEFAGIYRTDPATSEKQSELELKEDGEGIWRVGDNEETFSWYVKGDEIRLNTKKGGVIVAKIHENSLDITLTPGKALSFKKAE
jgi:hypothetical protein